jgi:hypothetical protein
MAPDAYHTITLTTLPDGRVRCCVHTTRDGSVDRDGMVMSTHEAPSEALAWAAEELRRIEEAS